MCLPVSQNYGDPRLLKEQDTLWEESRRLVNPHQVYVDLSQKLYDNKLALLDAITEQKMKMADE